MRTIEIVDNGTDRYTISADSLVWGRRYDNAAEQITVVKPEAEADSVCVLIATYGSTVVDHVIVGEEPLLVSSNLSQYDKINVGFAFTRDDGYIKNSEVVAVSFLPAQRPDGFVPSTPAQKLSIDTLIAQGFTGVGIEEGNITFTNTRGDNVAILPMSDITSGAAIKDGRGRVIANTLDSILNAAFVDVVLNGSTLEFKNAKGEVVKTVELPESGGGEDDTTNLLTSPITVTKQSGEDVGLLAQPYSLGLTAGTTYSVTHKYLGKSYTQSATAAEISYGSDTIVALGMTTDENLTLPIGNDPANGGIVIYDNFGLGENQEPVVQENSFVAMAMKSVEIDTIAQIATPDEPDEPVVDGNLLTAPVTFNSMSMTDTAMPQIDYPIGLKIDNTYTINMTIDGETIVIDDQPGIPSNYPNSVDCYGGVTLGNMGDGVIMGSLSDGRMYMFMVMDRADVSADFSATYNPNKASFYCMVGSMETSSYIAVPVTINSIVLKTSVPENRLTAPVTIPAQSTSNITGLTVQGELNLGSEKTTDATNAAGMCCLYKLEGTCGGKPFTSFLIGATSAGTPNVYHSFGLDDEYSKSGATACDTGELMEVWAPTGGTWYVPPTYSITEIGIGAAWNGAEIVAAEGSWAIKVEQIYSNNDEASATSTPEIVLNSITRMNLPNMLTEDISLSEHEEETGSDWNYPYYATVTKPTGVSLEVGARYILGINLGGQSGDNAWYYSTCIAGNIDELNVVGFVGLSAYASESKAQLGIFAVIDGMLYDNTFDPTKWTFTAGVDSPVTAFYLAKVE